MPGSKTMVETGDFRGVVELLGGSTVLQQKVTSALDAHELLLRGLPGEALTHLVKGFVILNGSSSFDRAVGMSVRTFQRRKGNPAKPLNPEQSGRTWKFAEVLAKATDVFGSREDAEQWLERPAIGLDQRRPIDLMATTAGTEIVQTHLERLAYGVYA